ncbi:MAG TPA: hypothetical protein VFE51_30720 [Verrucomicrobiae bacterium]|nr:hypothetical protein [Verrucomicrobiae bacterium]
MRSASITAVVCCVLIGALIIVVDRRLKDPHLQALHPMLNIVSVGVTNAIDDALRPMLLVKLTISNAPNKFDSILYVKGLDQTVEAQLGTNWIRIEGSCTNCGVLASQSHEIKLVIPEGSAACRVSFKYTGSSLFNGRLTALAIRLPKFLRSALPRFFWEWSGPIMYGPGSEWLYFDKLVPVGSNNEAANDWVHNK